MAQEMVGNGRRRREWREGDGTRAEGDPHVPFASHPLPLLLPLHRIYSGRTPELMHLATCCMACSGSVSMELLYYTKPTVIHYWISPLAYAVQKRFRKVKYITLVNLLSTGELYPADLSPYDPSQPGAEKVLFPEYLTCEDKSAAVAGHVIQWLKDPAALARQVAALEQLKAEVAHGGASARAAEYILRELSGVSNAGEQGSVGRMRRVPPYQDSTATLATFHLGPLYENPPIMLQFFKFDPRFHPFEESCP